MPHRSANSAVPPRSTHVPLGRKLRIEPGVEPCRSTSFARFAARSHAGHDELEFGSEGRQIGQSLQPGVVQIEDREAEGRGPGRLKQIAGVAGQLACLTKLPKLPSKCHARKVGERGAASLPADGQEG